MYPVLRWLSTSECEVLKRQEGRVSAIAKLGGSGSDSDWVGSDFALDKHQLDR
jgi:hypothetical protein